MFDDYLLENVDKGDIVGKVKNIISQKDTYSEAAYNNILELNKSGIVNILSPKRKYKHGIILKYNNAEREISVYRLRMYIPYERFKKNTFAIFLKEYAFSFLYMGIFLALSSASICTLFIKNSSWFEYIAVFFINIGIVFSNVLHETGHYIAARIFKVPIVIEICSFSANIITRADCSLHMIIIAAVGPLINLTVCMISIIGLKVLCTIHFAINLFI